MTDTRYGGTAQDPRFAAIDALMRADHKWHTESSPGDYAGGTDYWLTLLDAIPSDIHQKLHDQKLMASCRYHGPTCIADPYEGQDFDYGQRP